MANQVKLVRYWPAMLFATSSMAAIVLVMRAQSTYSNGPLAAAAASSRDSWRSAAESAEFAPVDETDPRHADEGYAPLLLPDWGSQFDTDLLARRRQEKQQSLAERLNAQLTSLRQQASDVLRREDRKEREARLLREPLRFNFYGNEGNYLGQHSILPPLDFQLPPLAPVTPLLFDNGGRSAELIPAGPRQFNVRIDPDLFRDEKAMAAFITDLTQSLVVAGVRPEIQISRVEIGSDRRVDPATGLPPGTRVIAPLRMVTNIPSLSPLPGPPADVVAGGPEPVFRSDITPPAATGPRMAAVTGSGAGAVPTVDEPRTTPEAGVRTAPRALGPAAAEPAADRPAGPTGMVELPGSADQPPREASPPATAPANEVRGAWRIRLESFPDRKAAERALEQLRNGGYGGRMARTRDGLEYWIVQSDVFTLRSEATRALSRVKSLGYDAWLN